MEFSCRIFYGSINLLKMVRLLLFIINYSSVDVCHVFNYSPVNVCHV